MGTPQFREDIHEASFAHISSNPPSSSSQHMDASNTFNEKRSFEGSLSVGSKKSHPEKPATSNELNVESTLPSSSQETSDTPVFSEGGLRAWLTVAGGAMMTFSTFGVVQSFGVYEDYYARITLTEKTPSEISWIGSIQIFLVFAVGLPAGKLMDMGYFHHTMIGGSIIYLISIFMLSLVEPHRYYQTFLAQGVGMGIGMGMMFLPSLTIPSHYFRKRRSLAMGIVVSGSSVGGFIYPVLLNNLFSRPNGFAWAIRAVAFIDLAMLIIANILMRPRLLPNTTKAPVSLKKVFSDVPFLVFTLGVFLVFLGLFIPFFYLQLFAALHGVDKEFAKYAITIMNAASLFGRTIPNIFADYYGPMNVLIASCLLTGGLVFGMFGATSVAGATVFGIFYGFFSGGAVSLSAPAVGSFVTTGGLSDLGIRIGIVSFVLAFSLLIGNPIAGALLTSEHHWQRPLTFAAVAVLAGAFCHLLVWRSLRARKGTRFI